MIARRSIRHTLRRHRRHGFQPEHLEERRVLDSTVVFNEIMYNPPEADDSRLEWIEFYNQLVVDMDISDWILTGGVEYKFPDNTIVPGKGYLVVAADPQLFNARTGKTALGPWSGQLNNAGETLLLYNNDARRLNQVDFAPSGEWPSSPDGTGVTLAKAQRQTDSENPNNWTFSEQLGGTPGEPNFLEPGSVHTTNLLVSPAPVRAIVPTNDALQLSWTQPGFDDAQWLSGTGGVGFDSQTTYNPYLGLDLDAPPGGQSPSPMVNVNTTAYLRFPFNVSATEIAELDSLGLRMRFDDGFVAYINGVEVAHSRAPGRSDQPGTLTWNSTATANNVDARAVLFENFPIANPAAVLQPGSNVLAIHALNRSLPDADALWDAELVGITELIQPVDVPLVINEVAAGGTLSFFIELQNQGTAPINLNGMTLRSDNVAIGQYALPNQMLAGGGRLVVGREQLGAAPQSGEHFILMTSQGRVLDEARVENRVRARSKDLDQRWMNAAQATPGAENAFNLTKDVVINEIMYNAAPVIGVPDTPAAYDRTTIIPMTHDQWRYNATGPALPADWATRSYPVNGADWLQGHGLIAYETSDLGVPINTVLGRPIDNNPRFITYYFQTDFTLTAAQLAEVDQVALTHMVDDGAVFYLNGQEVVRFNMPSGPIDSSTLAAGTTTNATAVGPIALPLELLKVGTNTLSAEMHLRTNSSNDAVFGAQLTLGTEVAPMIPGSDYRERSEMEWIELFNKGNSAVNLSGWEIDGGISLTFPPGSILNPQQYLVVAKDAAAFSSVYPGVRVVGNFSGSLSNHDDLVRLLDYDDNVADEVHYFEGGRWPAMADGGASSLELIDADADNNRGESWAASDESSKSQWITHTFRGTSMQDVFNKTSPRFNEFLFGLLDTGEFLIDDVQVIRNPGPGGRDMMQNGTFESDTPGQAPDKWRLIGNHSGTVIVDPTDPSNQVLHMVATGAQAFVHDHAETTFLNNEAIVDGTEYEISFRAKWLSGSSQLNSRLWFNRLGSTARLDVPIVVGTPGAANGSSVSNIGPSYASFSHSPTTPSENESVTVFASPQDPDGVASVVLHWREDGEAWTAVPMTADSTGRYQAQIPPHGSGTVVQFYVQATDGLGASSMYPAAGPESRALYQVEDGRGPGTPIDKFRFVFMNTERTELFRPTNIMSNWYLPITMMHNDTAYYDVDVRLSGSRWIRPNSGYKLLLNPDHMYNGVHDNLRFDLNGLAEIVMKQMLNRAGGQRASNYDDLAYLVTSRPDHSHEFILQMARYENIYLDEQFVDGSNGTKWELDDVTVATNPSGGVEGLKSGTDVYEQADIGVSRAFVLQQGDNPEFYRGHLLIKSNRAADDYQAIADLAQAIHQDGDDLFEATNEIMDVDLWMRHYANQSYFGNWDTYGFRRPKNLRIYLRPEDDRFIPLFWDCDLCNFTEAIKTRGEATSRLDEIRDIPHNLRLFWGHMLDYINRSFTEEYVARWAAHYGSLVNNQTWGGDETFQGIANSTATRSVRAMADMERDIPRVDFDITTNEGQEITVQTPTVMLNGKGWVDIRSIRLAGTEQPLSVYWPESDGWQIELPLSAPRQTITLEAIDYQGNLISTDSIVVNTTAIDPVLASLRISEIQYHPADPTSAERAAGYVDADDFEYIELTNIGSQSISLANVEFVRYGSGDIQQGVEFRFATGNVTELGPGASLVIVENLGAFRTRYGQTPAVAGQWSGGLGNASEQITLTNAGVVVHQFTYQDSWYTLTDGGGRSLQAAQLNNPNLSVWGESAGWRPSSSPRGTPGSTEPLPGDANGDGIFSSSDLVVVMAAGEYEDGIAGNSTFVEGDFNGDGDFSSSDLVWVFQYGNYSSAAQMALRLPPNDTRLAQVSTETEPAEGLAVHRDRLPVRPGTSIRSRPTRLAALHVDSLFNTELDFDRFLSEGDDQAKDRGLLDDEPWDWA